VTALGFANPEGMLKSVADQRQAMVAASKAAINKAIELQTQLEKVKGQVAALTQQKDAAMSEADTATDKASKASGKDASALLDAANEARRKGGNLGHEIDKVSSAILPLERDGAAEALKKKTADEGVAALDQRKAMMESNWQAAQADIQQQKAAAAKLGEQLAAQVKTLDDLTAQADALRAKAIDQFTKAAKDYGTAASEAKALATQLSLYSTKFGTSPEKKAWDQLKGIYHINIF